jgi:glycerol-3-phosphate dehydrogenase (NAD(P)+)
MKNICIIGAGKFGLSLNHCLNKKENKIYFHSKTQKYKELNYIKNVKDFVKMDYFILCMSSKFLDKRLNLIKDKLENKKILITEKSFDLEEKDFVSKVVEKKLKTKNIAFISGANLSKEILQNKICAFDISSKKIKLANEFKNLINKKYIINISKNILENQLSGIYKNIIAIGSGIIYSLNLGENFRNYFISKSLEELENLNKFFKLKNKSDKNTRIADLFLTCNSKNSRNFTFGVNLVKNQNEKNSETIEGLLNINILFEKIKNQNKENFKILNLLNKIIEKKEFNKKELKEKFEKLF